LSTAIVIPAYNEAATIADVVSGAAAFGTPVVVDDASTDDTGRIAAEAGAVVVRHDVNRGYDGAIESGFAEAGRLGADIVVTLDGDGQHEPSVLATIIDPLQEDRADLVIGIRPRPARFTEALFGYYTGLRFGIPDVLCGLKGYRMKLYRTHGCFDSFNSIGTELVLASLRQRVRTCTVAVPICDRADAPRIGGNIRANLKIMRALVIGIYRDIKGVVA